MSLWKGPVISSAYPTLYSLKDVSNFKTYKAKPAVAVTSAETHVKSAETGFKTFPAPVELSVSRYCAKSVCRLPSLSGTLVGPVVAGVLVADWVTVCTDVVALALALLTPLLEIDKAG